MTMLFRTSGLGEVPAWLNDLAGGAEDTPEVTQSIERLASVPASLDEAGLSAEMGTIEKCASAGTSYACPSSWGEEVTSQLREYAYICGIGDKFAIVKTPSRVVTASKVRPSDGIAADDALGLAAVEFNARTADGNQTVDLRQVVGDPFGLDEKGGMEHMQQADWQQVVPEQKLDQEAQSELMNSSAIRPAGGEFQYGKSPQMRVRPGQNSIADPDAIGRYAKEQTDTGERLRAQNEQHKRERAAAHKSWEGELVQQGKELGAGAMPRGPVQMTGSFFAQPGLRFAGTQTGVFMAEAGGAPTEMPERTGGEMLKQKSVDHREAIQRKQADKNEWQQMKGTSKAEVSDAFADSLEKALEDQGIEIQ